MKEASRPGGEAADHPPEAARRRGTLGPGARNVRGGPRRDRGGSSSAAVSQERSAGGSPGAFPRTTPCSRGGSIAWLAGAGRSRRRARLRTTVDLGGNILLAPSSLVGAPSRSIEDDLLPHEPLKPPPPIRDLPVLRLADVPEPREKGDVYGRQARLDAVWRWGKRILATSALLGSGIFAALNWESWAPRAGELGRAAFMSIERIKESRERKERQQQALQEASELMPHLAPETPPAPHRRQPHRQSRPARDIPPRERCGGPRGADAQPIGSARAEGAPGRAAQGPPSLRARARPRIRRRPRAPTRLPVRGSRRARAVRSWRLRPARGAPGAPPGSVREGHRHRARGVSRGYVRIDDDALTPTVRTGLGQRYVCDCSHADGDSSHRRKTIACREQLPPRSMVKNPL